MNRLRELKVKLFADGADLKIIEKMAQNPLIKGFTTNPTLMRKNNVADYKAFCLAALKIISGKPISFEVFSDDFSEMEEQAREIATWGKGVFVKIPVTNTKGEFAGSLIKTLSDEGVPLNITALMTLDQVDAVLGKLSRNTPSFVSIFAGRVADTGRDPVPMMAEAVKRMKSHAKSELIWASPRELLNIFQANDVGCHVITATNDILSKLENVDKDLDQFSLETVQMFYKDAQAAGFAIDSRSVKKFFIRREKF